MKVVVTGANSFLGASVVRALLKDGHKINAFVRSTSDIRSLQDLDVNIVTGDVLDPDSLYQAAKGCKLFFHTAAVFSYYGYDPAMLMKVASEGTMNAVKAAKQAKVSRFILTSSSVVLGSTDRPLILDEEHTASEESRSLYIESKKEQETNGFKLARELGIDIVGVYPTVCVGPHDYRLTESNAIILNYLNDPFRSTWNGGCNVVSVEDVARGHILAALHGKPGERYILGSENLHWRALHKIISGLSGIQGPLMTATSTASYLTGAFQELVGKFTQKRPVITRTQARMMGRYFWYSHERARALGYDPVPSRTALAKAISWLVASDHVSASLRNSLTLSNEIYKERQ